MGCFQPLVQRCCILNIALTDAKGSNKDGVLGLHFLQIDKLKTELVTGKSWCYAYCINSVPVREIVLVYNLDVKYQRCL